MGVLWFDFVDVPQTHKLWPESKECELTNAVRHFDGYLQVWMLVKVGSVRLVVDKLFAEIYTRDQRGRSDDETSRFTSKLQPTIRQNSSKYNANAERWPHQRTQDIGKDFLSCSDMWVV